MDEWEKTIEKENWAYVIQQYMHAFQKNKDFWAELALENKTVSFFRQGLREYSERCDVE